VSALDRDALIIQLRKDLERRARSVDNALRLQKIAEDRCKLTQQRLNEEIERQRNLAGHMRNTLDHMDEADAERISIDEPYWSVANQPPALSPQQEVPSYQWPNPGDFPEVSRYVDPSELDKPLPRRSSVISTKSAKKL